MRCEKRDVKEISDRLIEKNQMRELVDLINEMSSLGLDVEASLETDVMTSTAD